ncbi:MAG: protein kinase [Planctomycetota bacterium]
MERRPLSFQPGETLSVEGRDGHSLYFEVLGPLGAGGTGVVYESLSDEGELAVIKGPRFVGEVDPALAGELELLEALPEHPNLIRLLGKLRDPRGHHLIVLERAHEDPLLRLNRPEVRTRLRGFKSTGGRLAALPPAVALELAYELALALEHLHAHKVAHCDVKPDNLLLRLPGAGRAPEDRDYFEAVAKGEWRGVLIDLGGARSFRDLTRAYTGQGPPPAFTPLYTPPEVLPGSWDEQSGRERSRFSPWMDVYAFGLTLYQLLTGHVPYQHLPAPPDLGDLHAVAEVKREERDGGLRPVTRSAFEGIDWSDVRVAGEGDPIPRLTEDLWRLVSHTLHYDPARRPNLRRLAADLAALLGVEPHDGPRGWRQARVVLDRFSSRLTAAGKDGTVQAPDIKKIRRGGADFWEREGYRPTR